MEATCGSAAVPLKGRIRKSLKWGMVKDKSVTVVEAPRATV